MHQGIRDLAARGDDAHRMTLGALFRNFPNGLAVVNRAHVVEAENPALREILRVTDAPLVGDTCCSVLGCGCATEPDSETCIVDGVLRESHPIRDRRVELPGGRGAAWLSASVL